MKKLILKIIRQLSSILPPGLLSSAIKEAIIGLSESRNKDSAIRPLLEIDNIVYISVSRISRKVGDGVHSKHDDLKYAEFFAENLSKNEHLLDIGSGLGVMCGKIAKMKPDVLITGIEILDEHYQYALNNYNLPNIRFVHGNIWTTPIEGTIDVISFSNVLEHIENRVGLLNYLSSTYKPKKYLIRVPSYERDWRVPLKERFNVDYRLDPTHFIEYTEITFHEEMNEAGLEVISYEQKWGEIYSILTIKNNEG